MSVEQIDKRSSEIYPIQHPGRRDHSENNLTTIEGVIEAPHSLSENIKEPITIDLRLDEQEKRSLGRRRKKSMRPDGIALTSVYHLFSGCLLLALTCLLVLPALFFGAVTMFAGPGVEASIGVAIFGFMSIASMFLCLLNLVVGYGLWTQRQWARSAAIAMAFVSLLGFPIFTIIGGIIIWYLLQPQVAREFQG